MSFFKVIIPLLFSSLVLSSPLPNKDLSSPRATFNYFLKTMKSYKMGNTESVNQAIETFSNYKNIPSTRAKEYATGLISVLDKIEYIDVTKFPKKYDYDIWFYKKDILKIEGKSKNLEISLSKNKDGHWLFTKNTLNSVLDYQIYYKSKKSVKNVVKIKTFRMKLIESMPNWLLKSNFYLLNIQWLGLILAALLAFIIDRIIRFIIASRVLKVIEKRNITVEDRTQKKFLNSFGIIMFALVFSRASLLLELPEKSLNLITRGSEILIAISSVFALMHLVDLICLFLDKKAKATENKFDDILIPLIRKTSKFFVISFGVIYIGDALSINMKNILAGMGIGGIAFALAAKDTIGNLFGSFTVLVDRPFSIGDWVKINGKIEGTIVEVGLRSTRVRTFYDSIITVPNGSLTNAYIDNLGKRTYRRFMTKLGVDYDTPVETIENFCEGIRQLIVNNPNTRKDSFHVYFTEMGASQLDILVYMFWDVPDWSEELNQKHLFLLDIKRLAKKLNINFAFPTQTLHLIQGQNHPHSDSSIDFESMKTTATEIEGMRELRTHRSTSTKL